LAFFRLSSLALAVALFVVVVGATVAGHLAGRSVRDRSEGLREPFGVMQAAMLGFMGLVLAFGLSLAVGRYESRRAAVVAEANAIGTAYLRAQTLPEPSRTRSLELLRDFTDTSIRISRTVPASEDQDRALARSTQIERALWSQAGQALSAEPTGSAVRLYVESLNEAIDAQSSQVYGLRNRVPTAVLTLEIVGAAIALGLLALHLAAMGRGLTAVLVAAALVTVTLVITFDLDRPVRGLIEVSDAPLTQLRQSMADPPAADAPVTPPPGG
jgi:hypothetical protein